MLVYLVGFFTLLSLLHVQESKKGSHIPPRKTLNSHPPRKLFEIHPELMEKFYHLHILKINNLHNPMPSMYGRYIYLQLVDFYMVNVCKYTIHWCYGRNYGGLVEDHVPFFSWGMAVGEPAVHLPGFPRSGTRMSNRIQASSLDVPLNCASLKWTSLRHRPPLLLGSVNITSWYEFEFGSWIKNDLGKKLQTNNNS